MILHPRNIPGKIVEVAPTERFGARDPIRCRVPVLSDSGFQIAKGILNFCEIHLVRLNFRRFGVLMFGVRTMFTELV